MVNDWMKTRGANHGWETSKRSPTAAENLEGYE